MTLPLVAARAFDESPCNVQNVGCGMVDVDVLNLELSSESTRVESRRIDSVPIFIRSEIIERKIASHPMRCGGRKTNSCVA